MTTSLRAFLLVVGDIIALYAALFLTLFLRYDGNYYEQFAQYHAMPFTIIFIFSIVVFYIAGLYDLRRLRNNLEFMKTLLLALLVNAAISILLFYLIPAFGITPKTNLFIFMAIFALLEAYWRRLWNGVVASGEAPYQLILVGMNETVEAIRATVASNPQLGYEIVQQLSEHQIESNPALLHATSANFVVIPRHLKNNPTLTRELYALLQRGVEVRDLPNFYELIMRKVPLADLEESWFLEHLATRERFYDQLKRAAEFLFALVLLIVLLPLLVLLALLVAIISPGPIFYSQVRAGKSGRPFTLYKFRSMRMDAEKNGAVWSEEGDPRTTGIGKFLRYTHLDELPQLWNILRGELSFVGPRPERPEFVKLLEEQIPYYEVRHLVKPGVTGWAQVSYRYGSSVEDAYEKLQYDIYYIKNRSIFFDLAIVLKTVKSLFVNQ